MNFRFDKTVKENAIKQEKDVFGCYCREPVRNGGGMDLQTPLDPRMAQKLCHFSMLVSMCDKDPEEAFQETFGEGK